ncbi:hypothetical protein BOC36_01935 [Burkholderia pseudomallei]|nr:hypothetical protein BOC36_01935 [Burkholderia pseudomallei]
MVWARRQIQQVPGYRLVRFSHQKEWVTLAGFVHPMHFRQPAGDDDNRAASVVLAVDRRAF